MSIVVPSGGDFNVILKRATTRKTCSFPLQSSLTSQLLPGLPAPDDPRKLAVGLDLDAPAGLEVSLTPRPATPQNLTVQSVTTESLVATPVGFAVQLPPDPEC